MPTPGARADFKIGRSIRIDVGWKEQFVRVVTDRHSVAKFHDGQAVIEDFEGGFLSFPLEHVAHDEDRLTFPLRAEIAQAVLRDAGA